MMFEMVLATAIFFIVFFGLNRILGAKKKEAIRPKVNVRSDSPDKQT